MQILIITFFIIIFNAEWFFGKIGIKSKAVVLFPELFSLVFGILLILYFAINKNHRIKRTYLLLMVLAVIHIVIGLIGNKVQPLAIFAGLRLYLKYLPFYLLPQIYTFKSDQISFQIKALIAIAFFQCPLAFYQRIFEFQSFSGDSIAGTLGTAPMLSLFLISVIAVTIGFYLKGRLSLTQFLFISFIAFLPTSINETKATFILVPCAVAVPLIFGLSKEKRLKVLFTIIPALIVFFLAYNFLYTTFYGSRSDVLSFFTTDKVGQYLYKGAEGHEVEGEEGEVGRIDSVILAYEESSNDLFRLLWGVGIGNAAKSFSRKFEGDHAQEYLRLGGKVTGLSHFLWELGIIGMLILVLFLSLIFMDCLSLRNKSELIGSLALGWLGVTTIACLTLPYQNIIAKDALMYTFLYFSGMISAKSLEASIGARDSIHSFNENRQMASSVA